MNIFDVYERRLKGVIERLEGDGRLPRGLDLARLVVEPPRDPAHGDLASNAAMVLAKEARISPRSLAGLLAEALRGEEGVTHADIAGPGFINLRLAPSVFEAVLRTAVAQGPDYGRSMLGRGAAVNVEYVSANPTGPLHVGHGRGAVFGDALAALLAAAGYAVTREYYINDAGAQVDVLARSAFLRYREALGEAIGAIPDGLYPGEYLVPVGVALAEKYAGTLLHRSEAEWLGMVRDDAVAAMMTMIRADLAALGVRHQVFASERELEGHAGGQGGQAGQGGQGGGQAGGQAGGLVAAAIAELRARGLVYQGRLEPPKGQAIEDWENREQTLFRATDFGDDVDRPLFKSDGSYTYFANDIAYHKSKYDRGFADMIDVWGADHGGYVRRMQAAVAAITGGNGSLDVKLCQLVRLLRNGEPVKMSKRAGDFITLRDVIDEVGRDAVRFMMLFRKNDATLDFDLAKVMEQSKDNPVFYVQYAHARCASVFRQAGEFMPGLDLSPAALAAAPLQRLADCSEMGLVRLVAQYPRAIEAAALAHEPHRIAFFLHDLSSAFHSLWNKGKDQPALRFVNQGDSQSTKARLALVHAIRSILASGLAILGVSAPDEMR